MKNKSMLLNVVAISTTLILSSCSNKTEEICDCLKKAANTYMVKGEKAKEHDLMKMCNQFEGALKGASVDDKRIVETCLDTVKKHIEDKVLFTDLEQISLPNLPCGEDFTKELIAIKEEKITKKGERKAMNYYLKNRVLTCTIVVDRVVSDYMTEKPELYDGMIRVTGHLYDKSEILAESIELLLPPNEFKNIKRAQSYSTFVKNAEYPFQDAYSQLINFTGKFYEMPETAIGGILFMFKPEKFEYISPNAKTETATFKGQPKFIFNSNATTSEKKETEENNTQPEKESAIVYYKVQDPDGYSNLRSEPKGNILQKVYDTEKFEVVSTEGDFKKIKLSDGTIGYIHSSRVVKVD